MITEVQLATLTAEAPEGDEWLHELKFDGIRIIAVLDHGKVILFTRKWNDWTAQFPGCAEAVRKLPAKRAVIDGELAALMPDGRTQFGAMREAENLIYFAFDLIELEGKDLTPLPLEQRKIRLEQLVANQPTIRYSEHVIGGGPAFFAAACQRRLEGIISKRRDAPYMPGRGKTWLKIKCTQRQELVIGGFTEPSGKRAHLGALLVGYYEGGELRYAGKVGTGFTAKTLAELAQLLAPLEIAASPFTPAPPRALTGKGTHWVKPELVGEIAFAEWTADAHLRHPSFQGLRRDKPAREVVREDTR